MENGTETEEGFVLVHTPTSEAFTIPNTSDLPKKKLELVLRTREIFLDQNKKDCTKREVS